MFTIYTPSILGAFFKERRTSENYTISQLSLLTHYSTATLSNIENTSSIPELEKMQIILKTYNLSTNYFDSLIKELDKIVDNFINSILYIDDVDVNDSLQEIRKILAPYKHSILSLSLDLCTFIYNIYFEIPTLEKDAIHLVLNKKYFTPHIQYLCDIYIAQHYLREKNYQLAKRYLDSANIFSSQNHKYNQMLNYCFALYYLKINDPFNSIKFCTLAKNDFTERQNYKRLVNLNIIESLQYMNIGNYSKALEINILNLSTAKTMNLTLEKRIVLYNTAFIYILKENFEYALIYLNQILESELTEKHYSAIVYTLFEVSNFSEAKKMSEKGLSIASNRFYKSFLKAFYIFFSDKNHKELTNKIIKLYNQEKDKFDIVTKEYYLNIIIRLCQKNNQIKRINSFLNELYQLRIH